MKTTTGTCGSKPDEDVFPWFSTSPDNFIRLLWDLLPTDWRIVSFPHFPKDAYDPDEYLNASQIMVKDITEVMLEVSPSNSFRIYLGETMQVIKCTPVPTSRPLAAAWVDAIYAAMQLQAEEESQRIAEEERLQQQSTALGSEGFEGGNYLEEFLELREKYYQLHPDLKPADFLEEGGKFRFCFSSFLRIVF
jgi:hypothetical protein